MKIMYPFSHVSIKRKRFMLLVDTEILVLDNADYRKLDSLICLSSNFSPRSSKGLSYPSKV